MDHLGPTCPPNAIPFEVKPLFVEVTVAILWAGAWMVVLLWTVLKFPTGSLSPFLVFPILIPAVFVA